MRDRLLQEFLDAARLAYSNRARDPNSARLVSQAFTRLETPAPQSQGHGQQLPVCRLLNDSAAPANFEDLDLQKLMTIFAKIEPTLRWHRRQGNWDGASENFAENHANAIVVGPTGLEVREDVWLGVSLLGPNVLYPNHRHLPEETYLVVSPGQFRQGKGAWSSVGMGETHYNPHNIIHAMKSCDQPLLAFWALQD